MTTTATGPTAGSRLKDVDPATLKGWLDRNEAVLIDVREADEHASQAIDGAILLPLSRFDPAAVPAGDGRKVVFHCRGGNRSAQAAQKFLAAGRAEAWSLAGGIEAWKAAGCPTHVDRSAPIPIMRQVQIAAGALVLIGVALGAFVSPWFLIFSAFIGTGLVFAGASGWCGMAMMLAKMPWNR